jgi:signal transduction histidine kinase
VSAGQVHNGPMSLPESHAAATDRGSASHRPPTSGDPPASRHLPTVFLGLPQELVRFRDTVRRHPRAGDALVAVLMATICGVILTGRTGATVHTPSALDWGATVAGAVPLIWRRRAPVLVLAMCVAMFWTAGSLGAQSPAGVFLPLTALHAVARYRPLRYVVPGLFFVVPPGFGQHSGGGPDWASFVAVAGITLVVALVGINQRTRQAYLTALEERARRLEDDRGRQARLAVVDERTRIAREMHDIVAHHLTVMTALAEGAAATAPTDPGRAAGVMRQSAATGRQALGEMRRVLGLLRSDPAPAPGPPTATPAEPPTEGEPPTATLRPADALPLLATRPAGPTDPVAATDPLLTRQSAATDDPSTCTTAPTGTRRPDAAGPALITKPAAVTYRSNATDQSDMTGQTAKTHPAGGSVQARVVNRSTPASPTMPMPTPTALAPTPGLADIDELVKRVRAVGLRTSVTCRGTPQGWGPGAELAIYRIVQEALTNTMKHAGMHAEAEIRLGYGTEFVDIEVTDDGAGRPSHPPCAEDRHGLTGMRERAASFDGRLEAGPRPDRAGWVVNARLRIGGPVHQHADAQIARFSVTGPDVHPSRGRGSPPAQADPDGREQGGQRRAAAATGG